MARGTSHVPARLGEISSSSVVTYADSFAKYHLNDVSLLDSRN